MIELIVRPAAEADIETALAWYEQRELGLGGRFIDDLRRAVRRVQERPRQFPEVRPGARRALLQRFPYALYFVLRDESSAALVAVLHQRRQPATWKRRVREEGKAG